MQPVPPSSLLLPSSVFPAPSHSVPSDLSLSPALSVVTSPALALMVHHIFGVSAIQQRWVDVFLRASPVPAFLQWWVSGPRKPSLQVLLLFSHKTSLTGC